MFKNLNLENILFLDIETVPQNESFDLLPENLQKLWDKKSGSFRDKEQSAAEVYQRAGIYAEFGKIVCISVGFIKYQGKEKTFRLKSFANADECELLNDFCNLLNTKFNRSDAILCGHNAKEFDFPYIARRCLINGIEIPKILNLAGKKPWEVMHLDTLELWKFGDYKSYTSLNLLTAIFNIPTPKDDIDGSQVAEVFYKEKNLSRIVTYCQKDVLAVAQLILKFRCEELISEDNVIITPFSE